MKHMWMMLLCCIVPILLVFGALSFFDLPPAYLAWLPLVLCMLAHVVMMKFMHKGEGHGKNGGCH